MIWLLALIVIALSDSIVFWSSKGVRKRWFHYLPGGGFVAVLRRLKGGR